MKTGQNRTEPANRNCIFNVLFENNLIDINSKDENSDLPYPLRNTKLQTGELKGEEK